jgi:hypothetical protein
MMNYKNTFKALMAYLNPIGPIGVNIDMHSETIEYVPSAFWSEKGFKVPILDYFEDFIIKLVEDHGSKMFTKEVEYWDNAWWCDVTIDPQKRQIILIAKYEARENKEKITEFQYTDNTSERLFNYIKSYDTLLIDFTYGHGDFIVDEVSTSTNKSIMNVRSYYEMFFGETSFHNCVLNLTKEVINLDSYDEPGGSGTLVLNRDGNNRFVLNQINLVTKKAKTIIIDSKYMEKYD